MFKKYGIAGIILILFAQINFFLKLQPFANWYFPIIWFGYILTIDALIYKLRRHSLISSKPYMFLGILVASALFWWIFEFTRLSMNNWAYQGLEGITQANLGMIGGSTLRNLFGTISFATVLPAFFETYELIRTIHLFDKIKLKKSHDVTKKFLHIMIAIGIICLIFSLAIPQFAFPLIWLSFYFILDPINYLHKQPSIIQHLKDRRLAIPLSLLVAGIIMGFLWEFWNYWAIPKWTYNVPYVGFWKIFEMPILGYLGYFPFALELYAMYFFLRSLFMKKELLLVK